MKKILLFALAAFAAAVLLSCGKADQEGQTLKVGALKGPTAIGMMQMTENSSYDFTFAASADEITPLFIKGELDIISVPANLGSVLYNNTNGGVRAIAVNTLGVVYIVEKGEQTVSALSDLKGKTLLATGKGTTPESALTYLLSQNGMSVDDINIEWKNEPTEIVAQMSLSDHAIAMLPQPFVTVAEGKIEGLNTVISLSDEWDRLGNGSKMITSAIFVREAFAEKNPEAVRLFVSDYEKSCGYVNGNPAEAGLLTEKFGIVNAKIAEKAIPKCNIVCITGDEMKNALSGYLGILHSLNPKTVGGKLPGEDFYE